MKDIYGTHRPISKTWSLQNPRNAADIFYYDINDYHNSRHDNIVMVSGRNYPTIGCYCCMRERDPFLGILQEAPSDPVLTRAVQHVY